jgi:hypothetical protein
MKNHGEFGLGEGLVKARCLRLRSQVTASIASVVGEPNRSLLLRGTAVRKDAGVPAVTTT